MRWCCCPQGNRLWHMWKCIVPLRVGGGRRVEQRDSLELLGEGCDHSVIEHYCRIPHARARVQCTWQWMFTNTANLKCWYMMSCGSSCARHTPAHWWEPPKVEPYGGCHLLHQHLSPGSCTKNEASTSPLLSSTMPPLWGVSDQPAMIIQYQETLPVLQCVPAKQPEAWQKLWNWKRKYLKSGSFLLFAFTTCPFGEQNEK